MIKIIKILRKLGHTYRFAALILLNTLVVFLLINTILYVIFTAKDHSYSNPITVKYGQATVSSVYQELDIPEIEALLEETWTRSYMYEPFTQFKESPYRGHYVNVNKNGFRITKNQGLWPPESSNLNIFLFGGSTTFGYGIADHQTIASYLQEYLTTRLRREVRIYNFGRGHYYSTQERILFEQLLSSGIVPDIAMFIDGLNDFYYNSNEPLFTPQLREIMTEGTNDKGVISRTSVGRAVRGLMKLYQKKQRSNKLNEKTTPDYGDPKVINFVIERYLTNKKLTEAVSKSFGVKPLFVWQPVPTYHYDQQHHPFSQEGYGKHTYSQYGYKHLAELIKKNPMGNNFFWCADIQINEKRPLYIDKFHYSPSFSEQFAKVIADLLIERCPMVTIH